MRGHIRPELIQGRIKGNIRNGGLPIACLPVRQRSSIVGAVATASGNGTLAGGPPKDGAWATAGHWEATGKLLGSYWDEPLRRRSEVTIWEHLGSIHTSIYTSNSGPCFRHLPHGDEPGVPEGLNGLGPGMGHAHNILG